ncbi:MAG: hypothetical protein ACR2RL_14915 [Gammaproteobacteria bacterium]
MTDTPQPCWPGQRPGHPHDELLASYLVLDIQRSDEWAAELCERVRLVGSGAQTSWVRSGNAYHLILTRDTASIELLDGPGEGQPTQIPLDELRAAADAWREQIASPNEA